MTPEAETAYAVFWIIYVVAFLVFFLMMSRLFRILPLYGLRTLLQAALVVFFLVPVQSAEVQGWWMPAWLHGGYESILGDNDEAMRAWINMAMAAVAMLLVWMLDLVRYRLVRR